MKKPQIFLATVLLSISFCATVFAELQKIPIDTSHFWFWYARHSGSGDRKELPPNDSFKLDGETAQISCGNLSDKEHRYHSHMNAQGDIVASGDFKLELKFKNFKSLNADWQGMSFDIGTERMNIGIGIRKQGPYYHYETWVWPYDYGGLRLSTRSNSGTFVIERKGGTFILFVKGVPHATWSYTGINLNKFWLGCGVGTNPAGKVEVEILSISTEGVEIVPPGGPKPPPPPRTHDVPF